MTQTLLEGVRHRAFLLSHLELLYVLLLQRVGESASTKTTSRRSAEDKRVIAVCREPVAVGRHADSTLLHLLRPWNRRLMISLQEELRTSFWHWIHTDSRSATHSLCCKRDG